jgi:CAAX prenyl protease-like protein
MAERHPWLPYVAPFAAYMSFIAIEGLISQIVVWGLLPPLLTEVNIWLYPVKITVVCAVLWHFRHHYPELSFAGTAMRHYGLGVVVGVVVFLLWIRMDWPFATLGEGADGYNPYAAGMGTVATLGLIAIRLFGAALVVPIFEELFWRAFIMRYLVHPTFKTVALGTFTPASFAITCVLFGIEHHLWLAGIMAAIAYGGLLCLTRRLAPVVVAHGVTNLLLGVWVLRTGNWSFW